MSLELFYSYAHEDEGFREEIEKHLSILKRSGLIVAWHDRRIGAGDEWRDQIDAHARAANIILLLISPDFLASDYCYNIEMKLALERHATGDAAVVPIILRPVDWSGAPFAELQALPRDGKAVTMWANRDEAFANIALGIHAIVTQFGSSRSSETNTPSAREEHPQSRFLDAAIPSHIVKDRVTELQVLIRLPNSAGLKGVLQNDESAEARPEDVLSKDFKITFPRNADGTVEGVKAQVTVTAPDFKPATQTKQLIVLPDEDCELASFFLTALRTGKLKVLVELQWEETLRGARRLLTECVADAERIPSTAVTHVVRMPLGRGIEIDSFFSNYSELYATANGNPGLRPREAPGAHKPGPTASTPGVTVVQPQRPASAEAPVPQPSRIPQPPSEAPASRSTALWVGASGTIAAVIIAGVFSIYNVGSKNPPTQAGHPPISASGGGKAATVTPPPVPRSQTPAKATTDRAALELEITSRLNTALQQVDKLSGMRWLDGNANTNEGTSLRFAGQNLFGLLYFLDHPTGTGPNLQKPGFLYALNELKSLVPEEERPNLTRVANQYNVLKRILSDLPGENDVEHPMTREAVNATLRRTRTLLNSMLLKESRG